MCYPAFCDTPCAGLKVQLEEEQGDGWRQPNHYTIRRLGEMVEVCRIPKMGVQELVEALTDWITRSRSAEISLI